MAITRSPWSSWNNTLTLPGGVFLFFSPRKTVRSEKALGKIWPRGLDGVSKNNGTPKSSILIGFSIINHPSWGGNIHVVVFFLRGGGVKFPWEVLKATSFGNRVFKMPSENGSDTDSGPWDIQLYTALL